jgi:hypothetical protein
LSVACRQAGSGGARLPRPPSLRNSAISGASTRVALTRADVVVVSGISAALATSVLFAAARQTGQCCFEPFGCLPPSGLPSALVHSGIAPRIGSTISVLREEDGAQQNALAMTLPISATSARHVHSLRDDPRKFRIEATYAWLGEAVKAAGAVMKGLAKTVSVRSHIILSTNVHGHVRHPRCRAPRPFLWRADDAAAHQVQQARCCRTGSRYAAFSPGAAGRTLKVACLVA